MDDPVVIADYDPAWPARFEAEKARIVGAIGAWVVAVEHIGSTAVPGLAAKPILDIMVGLPSLDCAAQCIAPLQALGYEYVPEFEATIPERRYFRRKWAGEAYHLHMVAVTSAFWERHLLFRDYLRTHPETARAYERLKRELAARFGHDRAAYTDAKTAFITAVEEQARAACSRGAEPPR